MKPELKQRIIAYNKAVKERADKATDLDVLVSAIMKLPYGQLKKVLSDEVMAVRLCRIRKVVMFIAY